MPIKKIQFSRKMHSIQTLFITLSLFTILNSSKVDAIFGGRPAKVPPYDDPVVFINHVGRYSRVEGYFNPSTALYTFRGIRYAEPPIGENRFLRPKLKRLKGDVDARKNAPPCPQPDYYDPRRIIGDEDCLALNIFTPQMPDESSGLPVIVFIHGGGYRYGSASQYGAEPIAQENVIFVPIQYRLGTLGILGDGTRDFGGNAAIFDMHAALKWVTQYISFFGGDKNKIKVMGHGSGASAAMFVTKSPYGRSSVDGVIAMSGSSLDQYSYEEDGKNSTEEIASAHNCSHDNEMKLLHCLRTKSIDDIITTDSNLQIERLQNKNIVKSMSGMVGTSPNIEGKDDDRGLPGIITESPKESMKKEPERKIPILIGSTKHETANIMNPKEVTKIFGSASNFLKLSMNTLKLNDLLNVSNSRVTNVLSLLNIPSLNDYLTIPDNVAPEKMLNKLIDVSTDIFFNIPITLTANLWSKYAPAFFYQFDHVGDSSANGKYFLKPLPLVSKGNTKGYVAHGDELSYLFDAYDVFGNRINGTELKSSRDQEARKNFIKTITQFAYMNETSSQMSLNGQILDIFKADSTNFIKISDKLTFDKNFRICELSVLGAPFQATQKISCEFLAEGLKMIPLVPKVNDIIGGSGKKFGLF